MSSLITTFLISSLVTLITLPLIIKFALNNKLFDFLDERKQNRKPVPRIGGLSIFLGIIASLIFLTLNKELNLGIGDINVLLVLSIGFFLVGFVDDLLNISPWPRLIMQVALASIAWIQNIRIESIDLSYLDIGPEVYLLPNFISFIVTIFWIVGLTNAINWIDGLDGLAVGVTIIGVVGLILINLNLKQFDTLFILFPIAGGCLSFLKYNFFPAKILMGDGGSYLLGFLLAFVSIISTTRFSLGNSETLATAIYIPIILFSVPILDMCSVIISRILDGRSPFYPDNQHLHHRLIARGLKHRDAVMVIYLLSIFALTLSNSLIN